MEFFIWDCMCGVWRGLRLLMLPLFDLQYWLYFWGCHYLSILSLIVEFRILRSIVVALENLLCRLEFGKGFFNWPHLERLVDVWMLEAEIRCALVLVHWKNLVHVEMRVQNFFNNRLLFLLKLSLVKKLEMIFLPIHKNILFLRFNPISSFTFFLHLRPRLLSRTIYE